MKSVLGFLFACALALSAADLTGKWTGTFTMINASGEEVKQTGACLNLRHSGSELRGTAGPSEEEQSAISSGKADGDRIRFELSHPNGSVMKFDLRLAGDRLQGEISGEHDGQMMRAKLDVSRAAASQK